MTTKMAATFQTTAFTLRERLANNERGASALEYVGMVLVAAFIVGAIYTAFSGADLAGKVKTAITDILKGPSA
ncbi:hypothetical protein [Janibacter sp. G56]|uniref:hypothetical protein n=1 Tax=Janibacter sp. G56 TaxID=3418717 RepID=UPI003D07A192